MTRRQKGLQDLGLVLRQGRSVPTAMGVAIASAAANVTEVTLTLQDADGNTIAAAMNIMVWLSDAATGVGLTTTSASGTVAAKSASGQDMGILTAKKALMVQTLADGTYILEITDTAKTGFYVASQALEDQAVTISRALVTGDYG